MAFSSTAYVLAHTLTRGHSETINAVSFSLDGNYLASGADDNSVIIWSILDGSFLYRFVFESAVDCILWHPILKETLIIGCGRGPLFQLRDFSLVRIRL